MVVTPDATATAIGLDVLRDGANAVDAAVAVAAALMVAQPNQCGLGGDAFWLVRDRSGPTVALDGTGHTPAGTPVRVDEPPALRGGAAVSVPGVVSGWAAALERFGSRSAAALLAPAIALAEDGVETTARSAAAFAASAPLLRSRDESRRVYLVDGEPPAAGVRRRQPDIADTLRLLGADLGAFYAGALADAIAAAVRAEGGTMTPGDLAAHRAEWKPPVRTSFRGWEIEEMPAPSQGSMVALGLRLADVLEPVGGALDLHLWIEIARVLMAVRDAGLGDGSDPAALVDADELTRLAGLIDPRRTADPATLRGAAYDASRPIVARPGGDTVHFAIVDERGLAVSCVQSVFHDFGSGIVVPGTGILLHNRASGMSADPSHPDAFGPSRRPMHTLAPGLATRDGALAAVFGCMGGHAQAQLHLQMLDGLVVHGLDPAVVTARPRWFADPSDATVLVEDRDDLLARVRATGHPVVAAAAYDSRVGHEQIIVRDPATGDLEGAADPRSDGQALGY